MIHLAYEGLQCIRQRPRLPLWKWLWTRRFWVIAIGWIIVFFAGMVWLGYKNNFAEPRLQIALTLLKNNINQPVFWRQMLLLIGHSGLLLLPVIVTLWLVMSRLRDRSGSRLFLLWGIGVVVLTALNFVQSVHYYNQPLFYLVSLTWPPRFVLLWAFSAAFLTLVISLFSDRLQPVSSVKIWFVGAGLFFGQIPVLYLARPDFPSLRNWARTLQGKYADDKDPALLRSDDLNVVKCLADQLPSDANVFSYDFLVPFFHRQYGIWPTGKQYKPADVAVIPINDKQGLRNVLPMRQPYRVIRLKSYDLYIATDYEYLIRQCIR
ncbi:hypothetical protein [Spirosoma validum]|uniref:Uncharacterized protein n=1 Tax=Spirosoma validum TaxID=2771355 RepID=A0A927GCM2_9BACT|nr:hypothetical protein [Spirosoma validum]MBD2752902.1 hypothetical protein [Spirosoma validum]